ncbi:TetR family transcriptional regulator [Agarivorans sp. TSD2052]|uniref:TetR/AcrR family transcriptional regulator n=1 Tax=Agarivorans sp. TSD2052 TaxID=2937286 RepID=UPI00200BC43E|nr:TetR/AcrR family transcriptional regulator [Agarivorans sp. TSD2052]UPW20619.1 TetR family transcriptional regulator [Agarivorans sp. TSD2052]
MIKAATILFVLHDYDKVSIRMIAAEAAVDPALIRYYFGNKANLFGEMLNSVAKPVFASLDGPVNHLNTSNLTNLMRNYYKTMVDNPNFPKLIFKLGSMPNGHESTQQFEHVINNMGKFKSKRLFEHLCKDNSFIDGVDAELAQLSFMSLMVFPFLMPQRLLEKNGIQLSKDKFIKLAEHNIQLLERGLFKQKDDNNESS